MSFNTASTAPGVDLKLTYENTQRRFSCSSKRPSWQGLAAQVKRKFSLPEDFNLGLSFVDAQGEATVLSSDSQLEHLWPVNSEAGDLFLDSLAPLEFTILRLPPSQRNKNTAANSRSTSLSATILDESDFDSDDNGIVSVNSDGDEHAIQVVGDAHAGDGEGGDKNKKRKPSTLQEDIRSFVHIVQETIQDNGSIKKAFDKLLSHVHKGPEHDGDRDSGAEDANADLATIIAEETGNMDAMTAGIVSALLAPALMGPPPPPPGPPPHFPPHYGGPPHHHHRGHGGPHRGKHHFGPPLHHGPPPPPHGGPQPPPPPHCGPGGKGRHPMSPGPPPFFRGPHHHFDNPDYPSDEEFEDCHTHHGGPHRFGFGEGRQPLFPGSFRHGKNRGCPYDVPPPPPRHPFHGMIPGFGPFGGGRHVPSFGPRRPLPFPHMQDPSLGFSGKYGPGPGPHRHGHHGRHAHFFQEEARNGLDDLRGGFEAMRMNNNNPAAFGEEDNSTASSDESEVEFIEEKQFERSGGPLGRHGYRSRRHGHLDGPHPPPLPPHHKHHHVRHEEGSRRGPPVRGGPHHHREHQGQKGPRPHRGGDDLPPAQSHDDGERRSRHKVDIHHRHGHHHGRWA